MATTPRDHRPRARAGDLEPGGPRRRAGRDGGRAPARRGAGPRGRVRGALRRQGGRARRRRPRGGDARDRRHLRPRRARGQLRPARLLRRHAGPGARGARREGHRAGDGDRDQARLLRARVGGAAGRARRRAPAARGPRLRPPLPAQRAPLHPPPPHRARGEADGGEGADRAQRLGPPVRRADGAGRGGGRAARGRAEPPDAPRPRDAAHDGRGDHRGARARPAHARLHLQHARARQVRRRPAAQLLELGPEPQPVERGQRRVGPGARRRRPGSLRDRAPLVPAEGEAARRRPARRLRPDGAGHHRRGAADRVAGGQDDGPRLLPLVLGELGDLVTQFYDDRWIDAPVRPHKRGGAFCAYTVPPSTRTCCSTTRRAGATS